MRIVVVNNFFPPRPGGSSHLADNLAREYASAGHEVLVLTATYGDAPTHERRDGFEIVRIPAWTLPKTRFAANFDIAFTSSPRAKRRVFDILDDFAPDVVHQHGQFFDLTWLSGWWARSRKRPTLLSIHTRLESPLSKFNSFIYAMADRLLVVPLMKVHRPMLVVMDKLMDEYIEKRYSHSISGKVVIPVGIDPEKMRGGDPTVVAASLDTGDRPLIVSLGHVIPQRNRLALVRAMPRVLLKHPDAIVVVVGGVYHDEFLAMAKELGVQDSLKAVGARPQREIPDYLAAAAVEVHELEGQGFGTASLEALAAGVPVAAGVREDNFLDVPLRDGAELFLVEGRSADDDRADVDHLADVLIRILDDPNEARAAVSENARALIEDHFTIKHVADAHLSALAQMCPASVRE